MTTAAPAMGPVYLALVEARRGLSLDQVRLFLAHLSGWVAGAIDTHGFLSADSFRSALDAAREHAMGAA